VRPFARFGRGEGGERVAGEKFRSHGKAASNRGARSPNGKSSSGRRDFSILPRQVKMVEGPALNYRPVVKCDKGKKGQERPLDFSGNDRKGDYQANGMGGLLGNAESLSLSKEKKMVKANAIRGNGNTIFSGRKDGRRGKAHRTSQREVLGKR